MPVCLSLISDHKVVGGLTGKINWDWFYIETLAVDLDFRKRGLGTKLILSAETIARKRNCIGIWVDTYTFQSPVFYERLGYAAFGSLPNHPRGESRVFLQKIF